MEKPEHTFIFLIVFFTLLVFTGCAFRGENDLKVVKLSNEGLVNSNYTISKQNERSYESLIIRLQDPTTRDSASVVMPKAKLVRKISLQMYTYFDSLKLALKREAGLTNTGIYREDDLDAVKRMFVKNEQSQRLYERLQIYKTKVSNVDKSVTKDLSQASLESRGLFSPGGSVESFSELFNNVPVVMIIGMLEKLENNSRIIEGLFLEEEVNKIRVTRWHSTPWPIIGVSSNYIQAGQSIEITAGIGSFEIYRKCEMKINGKLIPSSERGVLNYSFIPKMKPGKHAIPVEISYFDRDGNKNTMTKKIELVIVE